MHNVSMTLHLSDLDDDYVRCASQNLAVCPGFNRAQRVHTHARLYNNKTISRNRR